MLKDEATIDEVAIPVQGGTFYLLPAGTPIQDTSRLLQSPKFGQLISQLRQLYDLIIIDSPPVLPVPDALILGRWADGAVIAARYDISRFPQVERARRQLDNAGIAVLGTVINGMRHSDSYYGRRYTNSRRRSNRARFVQRDLELRWIVGVFVVCPRTYTFPGSSTFSPQKKQQLARQVGCNLRPGYGSGSETIVTSRWDARATHGDGVCAVV